MCVLDFKARAPHVVGRHLLDEPRDPLFTLAASLLSDEDVLVSKPVGIALKYAGLVDEQALVSFLDSHANSMQRAALRYAVEKLPAGVRARYR